MKRSGGQLILVPYPLWSVEGENSLIRIHVGFWLGIGIQLKSVADESSLWLKIITMERCVCGVLTPQDIVVGAQVDCIGPVETYLLDLNVF